MTYVTARVLVEDMMGALGLSELPVGCTHTPESRISFDDAEVDQDEIDSAATDSAPEAIDPGTKDLRDGLLALRGGDVAMARILLDRAFDAHSSEVQRVVTDALAPASKVRAA